MKIKREFLCTLFVLLLGLGLFLAIYCVSFFHMKTTVKEKVLYFGESGELEFLLNSDDFMISPADAVSEIDLEACGNIIVAGTERNDINQDFFLSMLERGGRILLLGDIGKAEIADYFGFEINEIEESQGNISRFAKEEDEEMEFVLLGTMIYISGEEEIVVDILVQRTDKNKLLTKAVQYCFMYDYTGQTEKNILTAPFLFGKTVSYKRTYVAEEFIISIVFGVDTYWKNPNPAGQYLANIPCLVDISAENGWSVSYVDMELEGADSAKIYSWDTKSLGLKHKIETTMENGGVDKKSVRIFYRPKGFLGIYVDEPAGLEIRTYIRTYQETEHIMCGKGYISVAMKRPGWWKVKEDTITYRIDLPVCTVEGRGK